MATKKCSKCGKENLEIIKFCSECGNELENNSVLENSESNNLVQKKKGKIIVSVLIITVLLIAGIIIKTNHDEKAKKVWENNYINCLTYLEEYEKLVSDEMNTYETIWLGAAAKVSKDELDKYLKDSNGKFVEANEALNNYHISDEHRTKMNAISDKKLKIIRIMQELSKYPDGYKDLYFDIKNLDSFLSEYYCLSEFPEGITYFDFRQKLNEFYEKYPELYEIAEDNIKLFEYGGVDY